MLYAVLGPAVAVNSEIATLFHSIKLFPLLKIPGIIAYF